MLPIAGQTAGPIGLKFVVVTHGWPGSVISPKKFIFKKKFQGQRRALQLVDYKTVKYKVLLNSSNHQL